MGQESGLLCIVYFLLFFKLQKKFGESVLNLEDFGLDDILKFICEVFNVVMDEEGEIIVKIVVVDFFVMGRYFMLILLRWLF